MTPGTSSAFLRATDGGGAASRASANHTHHRLKIRTPHEVFGALKWSTLETHGGAHGQGAGLLLQPTGPLPFILHFISATVTSICTKRIRKITAKKESLLCLWWKKKTPPKTPSEPPARATR